MKVRSTQLELLDSPEIPKSDLFQNLRELHVINRLLGGYNLSILGLKRVLKKKPNLGHVLDIGFGGGDFLKVMALFSEHAGLKIKFTGVDIKPDCVEYAKENLKGVKEVNLIESDYRNLSPLLLQDVDLVHVSLFLHHLTDSQIIDFLRFCKQNNCLVLVNDLERHPLAMQSIKWLTRFFSRSYLVKNDAPLSVRRAFRRNELKRYFEMAGYSQIDISWVWAFRYCVIAWK